MYNGTLGEGKKSSRGRKEWYEGKHQEFIDDALFDHCQEVRAGFAKAKVVPDKHRIYVLHDRVYCAECLANKPDELADEYYGKMRPFWHTSNEKAYYRCLANQRGYESCGQPFISVRNLDEQVVEALSHLSIPDEFRERVEAAVHRQVEHDTALARMGEIREIIERVDFPCDQGFISHEECIEKRQKLQQEMDVLRPMDCWSMIEAADLIENFRFYWEQCAEVDRPEIARQQLLQKIVERVLVHNGQVSAMVIRGGLVMSLEESEQMTN